MLREDQLDTVGRILGIVSHFRLFFGIKMVEVAEKLIEPVDRGQFLVPIADVVFAKRGKI